MGFAHSTAVFPELLYKGLADIWGNNYKDYPTLYTQFFKVEKSEQNFEKEQQITGLPTAVVKSEGNEIEFQQMYQGYQKEYRHATYAIGAEVTREMVEDDQYSVINQIPSFIARSMREVEEVVAHNVFNYGFDATNYPQADGSAFFSTSHQLVGISGGTIANTPATATDLSMTSLEQGIIAIMDFVDDQGLKRMFRPTTLVVPTALSMTARKILETEYAVGSADNDKNIVASYNLKLVVSPYLTDNDAWFLVTDAPSGLKFKVRRAPDFARHNEFNTQNMLLAGSSRFSCGVTDSARAAYASPGA